MLKYILKTDSNITNSKTLICIETQLFNNNYWVTIKDFINGKTFTIESSPDCVLNKISEVLGRKPNKDIVSILRDFAKTIDLPTRISIE